MDLVPEDASVVLVAQPAQLVSAPAARRVLDAIASDDALERYRAHTGIDPRRLEQLVWAETGAGSVLLVRGPFSAPLAVAEMGHRMLPVEASAEAPFVRRVGHYQGARRDLVALSQHVLVAITGAPSLAQEVLRRAEGGPRGGGRGAPSVLSSEPVASMLAAHPESPLFVVAPRPLGLPIDAPIGLLLARQRGLFVGATPSGPDAIAIAAELWGEFPPEAGANFRALAESLAQSDLGVVLGMNDALPTLGVRADAERVSLRATFSAPAVAAGLHVLLGAEIADIVEVSVDAPVPGAALGPRPD